MNLPLRFQRKKITTKKMLMDPYTRDYKQRGEWKVVPILGVRAACSYEWCICGDWNVS